MTKYNARVKALKREKKRCITLIKYLPRRQKNHKTIYNFHHSFEVEIKPKNTLKIYIHSERFLISLFQKLAYQVDKK